MRNGRVVVMSKFIIQYKYTISFIVLVALVLGTLAIFSGGNSGIVVEDDINSGIVVENVEDDVNDYGVVVEDDVNDYGIHTVVTFYEDECEVVIERETESGVENHLTYFCTSIQEWNGQRIYTFYQQRDDSFTIAYWEETGEWSYND